MNIIRIAAAILLTSCQLSVSRAEGRSAQPHDAALSAAARLAKDDPAGTAVAEVFANVVVAPGNSLPIDSTVDYSSATTVAVAVQCTACTTAATSLGTVGLILQARWSVPTAELMVATENKAATTFPYWDAGGAIFNVYGPQFRLVLQNTGTQPITLQQVTIFRRSP